MATRRPSPEPKRLVDREYKNAGEVDQSVAKLRRRIEDVRKLREVAFNDARVKDTESRIQEAIREAFGESSHVYNDYEGHRIFKSGMLFAFGMRAPNSEIQASFLRDISNTITMLESLVARLEEKKGDLVESPSREIPEDKAVPDRRKIFVIHGRNLKARKEMGIFLRALGLEPMNFADLRAEMGGTPTIADIVEEGMNRAQGVVALFTPDEYAALRPELRSEKEEEDALARWQARPNVIFEAGMAFGRDRDRVVFVLIGDPKLFTDVAGIHVLRPTNDPLGDRQVLRNTLKKGMRCAVSDDSNDWMDHGDFEGCVSGLATRSPSDPFGANADQADLREYERPTLSEGDARTYLIGWLSNLPVGTSGKALSYEEIAADARVAQDQVRDLLPSVVGQSGSDWRIQQLGETVVILRWEPKPVVTARRKSKFDLGGY